MPDFYLEGDEPKLADPTGRSLHKINNLLKIIEAKTGSTTITGPVTVSNEVEVTNSTGNPIPVSGTVALDSNSLAALENISVTFPATQNVNVTNAGLNVSVSNLPATQAVSLASAPVTPVTDNGGSLTVDGTFWPTTQPVSLATAPTTPVTGTFWQTTQPISGTVTANTGLTQPLTDTQLRATAVPVSGTFFQGTQPVSLASAPVTPITDNGGSLTVDGTVTVNDMTSGNAKTKIVDSVGADVSYITAGTAGTPSAGVLSVQGINGGVSLPISGTVDTGLTQPLTDTQLRATAVPVSGTFFQATQPTRETQPTGDYVVNVGAASTIPLSGSAVTTASFDAGTTADYIVVTIEGGGTAAGFYIDGSPDNTSWTSGQYIGVYYDVPTFSSTDAYSYRTVIGQLFGATRSSYSGRFIVSCTQPNPFVNLNSTYRYFRITTPAAYGGWRYKFVSYKTTTYSLGHSNPGGVTRVNGRVDVGYVANLPTLSATVTQATATSLRAQAEAYQGGTAVGSANPLQVTLANTATNATAVKVDGSAVTQPISGTVTINNSQGASVTQSTFISTTASTSLVAASATRKGLTVYNAGFGDLYICAGATCTTTSFQLKLVSGDYWECPPAQVTLAHAGVYATAGTAYVTTIT